MKSPFFSPLQPVRVEKNLIFEFVGVEAPGPGGAGPGPKSCGAWAPTSVSRGSSECSDGSDTVPATWLVAPIDFLCAVPATQFELILLRRNIKV